MKAADVKTLVDYRMKEAHAALADADFLLQSERSFQSIVNRAYYAMFYAVLALAQLKGCVPSKHTGAISMFDRDFVKKDIFPREMSKNLHKAFELRQTSDYQVGPNIDDKDVTDMLLAARAFVENISEWLSSIAAKDSFIAFGSESQVQAGKSGEE